jgi:two-component system NarL family response regulator
MPIRVLLVDNQTLLRHGIRLILQSARNIEVIGEAADGNEAVDKAVALSPDIVLIESVLAEDDSLAVIRAIKQRCPSVRTLVLSSQGDPEVFRKTAAAGAIGYILKDISPEDLVNAIRATHSGRTILSPTIAPRIVRNFSFVEENANGQCDRGAIRGQTPGPTGKEIEVLSLVACGLSDKEIAAQLYLSESTVKSRLRDVYRKLGLKNRAQAAVFIVEKGLLSSASV